LQSQIPIDVEAPAAELLKRLRGWAERPTEHNSLLFVSLSALPTGQARQELWDELHRVLASFRQRHGALVYRLSLPERALLVKITEFNKIGMFSDLKVELLRLIQQHFPEQFGVVDQSRLIRPVDLRLKLQNAIKFLERFETPGAQPVEKEVPLRPLREADIRKVMEVNERVGKQAFVKVFIRRQRLAIINPGEPPSDVMNEYYVGMDMLKKHVFKDVELRGAGNVFNQLTLLLDRILLDSFGEMNPERAKCSINLNVESVFTRAFESLLANGDENVFSNIVFEFRQANILQHHDEYEVAANLIRSKNGTVAVDAVFPETVGLVNLPRLGATMAKIFWRQGAEAVIPVYRNEIESMRQAGVTFAIARLDDEAGIDMGHSLGINMFQGFLIDRMLGEAG
jgi:hypothetical protein